MMTAFLIFLVCLVIIVYFASKIGKKLGDCLTIASGGKTFEQRDKEWQLMKLWHEENMKRISNNEKPLPVPSSLL
jgi:hypothetical protein